MRINPALVSSLRVIGDGDARESNVTEGHSSIRRGSISWQSAGALIENGFARRTRHRSGRDAAGVVEITDLGRKALAILKEHLVSPGELDALAVLAQVEYAVESNRTQPATDGATPTIIGRVSISLRRAELVRAAAGWSPASGRVEITDKGREVLQMLGGQPDGAD
jgi:hypothetical protein